MPETKDEIVHALPSTIVSGFTAGATTWFGIEHYLADIDRVQEWMKGFKGECLIHRDALPSNLKSIVRTWKVDNPGKGNPGEGIKKGDLPEGYNRFLETGNKAHIPEGQRIYRGSQVLNKIEEYAVKYGLKDEVEFIGRIRQQMPEVLEASTDATSRVPLAKALDETGSEFFKLFHDAVERHDSHSKARMAIDGDAETIRSFRRTHNHNIINRWRLPAVAVITGVVAISVARSDIKHQRKEEALEDKLDYYHGKVEALEEKERPL